MSLMPSMGVRWMEQKKMMRTRMPASSTRFYLVLVADRMLILPLDAVGY